MSTLVYIYDYFTLFVITMCYVYAKNVMNLNFNSNSKARFKN